MTRMWTELRTVSFMGLAVALGLSLPAVGAAQMSAGTAGVEQVNDRTARMLEDEAEARAASLETYAEAGDLYRKAAVVRGDDDPRAVENLRSAARLAHYAGQNEQAVKDFVRAGDVAQALEMPSEALDAYFDAAWVAQETGQRKESRRLLERLNELVQDEAFMAQVEPDVVARVRLLTSKTG